MIFLCFYLYMNKLVGDFIKTVGKIANLGGNNNH